jgi:hypothetical protein
VFLQFDHSIGIEEEIAQLFSAPQSAGLKEVNATTTIDAICFFGWKESANACKEW